VYFLLIQAILERVAFFIYQYFFAKSVFSYNRDSEYLLGRSYQQWRKSYVKLFMSRQVTIKILHSLEKKSLKKTIYYIKSMPD